MCPQPMVWHQISALARVEGLTEILLLGVYEDSVFADFVKQVKREFPNIAIRSVAHPHSLGRWAYA